MKEEEEKGRPKRKGNAPPERRANGTFLPGNTVGTPWGPDNPPPKSPGRPVSIENRIKKLLLQPVSKKDRRQRADAIAEMIVRKAMAGEDKAWLELLNRFDGKPTEKGGGSSELEAWGKVIQVIRGPAHHQQDDDE